MDYEKKYNEALAWMRSVYSTLQGATKEDAEHYFPELRESEDERIRKALLEYFGKQCDTATYNGIYCYEIYAWLEKQKYEYEVFEPVESTLEYKMGFAAGQKEQKPVGWSEEDEKILDSLIRLYSREYSAYAWPWANGAFTYGDVVNFLKSLRPHWKPSEEQMKALQYYAENMSDDVIKSLYNDLKY